MKSLHITFCNDASITSSHVKLGAILDKLGSQVATGLTGISSTCSLVHALKVLGD